MRYLPLFAAIFAITPLAIDLYLPAMPQIALYLDTNIQVVQNTLSIYLAGYALGMFLFGPLADHFGRRPLLITGLCGFLLFTLLLSITETAPQFLIFRFFQALCGGAATVVIPGAIKQLFGKDTAKGISYVSMIMMIAPMLAPALGSIILVFASWSSIFQILGVYTFIILVLAARYFPALEETQTIHQPNRIIGKLNFVASYRSVLATKSTHGYLCISMLASVVFFTYLTSVSFLYIQVFAFSEQLFSLLFGLNVVALMAANYVNTRLVPLWGSAKILNVAAILSFFSVTGLLILMLESVSPVYLVACLITTLAFITVIVANSDSMILQQFTTQTGTATAVIGCLRFACGALAGPLLSYFFNGSAIPIVMILFAATLLMALIVLFLWLRKGCYGLVIS